MRPGEVLSLKRAADHAGRDDSTLRRWAKIHGIARQAGRNARLKFSAPGLEMVLQGEFDALEHLRAGRRNHPDVVRIFDHLGLDL